MNNALNNTCIFLTCMPVTHKKFSYFYLCTNSLPKGALAMRYIQNVKYHFIVYLLMEVKIVE